MEKIILIGVLVYLFFEYKQLTVPQIQKTAQQTLNSLSYCFSTLTYDLFGSEEKVDIPSDLFINSDYAYNIANKYYSDFLTAVNSKFQAASPQVKYYVVSSLIFFPYEPDISKNFLGSWLINNQLSESLLDLITKSY